MDEVLIGIFIILHGLVYLLYLALSRQLFDLDPPLVGWPQQSWAFSKVFEDKTTRSLAGALYGLAIILFVISGIGILLNADWQNGLLVGASVYASAITILFWDGKMQRLPDKGFIGVLINVVVLGAVLLG